MNENQVPNQADRWRQIAIISSLVAIASLSCLLGVLYNLYKRAPAKPRIKIAANLESGWLKSLDIPEQSLRELLMLIEEKKRKFPYREFLSATAKLMPMIDPACQKENINPEIFYGLITQECQGNPEKIDFKTMMGTKNVRDSHVGIGQLSESFLSTAIRLNPDRLRSSSAWQQVRLRRLRTNPKSLPGKWETELLHRWMALDPRFNARWNLEKTIHYFKYNLRITGDPTLAIMAHYRGTYQPLWWVAAYREDHGGPKSEKDPKKRRSSAYRAKLRAEIPAYIRSHHIDYFTLRGDNGRAGSEFRKNKDTLYPLSVMAWTELFAQYLRKDHTRAGPPSNVRTFARLARFFIDSFVF